jgi:DNA-binding NarL/FixJ family response regulator
MSIRLLLVDDHPVVTDGLAGALERQEGMTVVAVAATLEAGRAVLEERSIDVGLVDVRLPDGVGLELISEFPRSSGGPAWIVLSSYDLTEYVAAGSQRGASGYLLKTAPLSHIVDAIRRVATGGTAFEARHLAAQDRGVVPEPSVRAAGRHQSGRARSPRRTRGLARPRLRPPSPSGRSS